MRRVKVGVLGVGVALALCGAAAPSAFAAADFVVTGTKATSGLGVVRVYADTDRTGTYETLADEFVPFSSSALTPDGVRVAAGDFDGDLQDELVVAAGETDAIRIYEMTTSGEVGALSQTVRGFSNGSYVAAGDIGTDGRDELAVGSDPGSNTKTKIFTDDGEDGVLDATPTENFYAYPGGTGGARVAFGNVNNSGGAELVTGPGPDAGQPVKVWRDADSDGLFSDDPVFDSFVPYGASFVGGTHVAVGPIQNAGNGGEEVVVSAAATAGKNVIIRTDADGDGLVSDNPPFEEVAPPYGSSQKGARVALGDTDHSSFFRELITASGGPGNNVKIYDDDGDIGSLLSDNPLIDSFGASTAATGSFVAFAREAQTVRFPMPGLPVTIADSSTTTSKIKVPQSAGIAVDVDLEFSIAHTFDGDLDIALTQKTPAGTTFSGLLTNIGGDCEGMIIRLDDEAGTDVGTATCAKPDGVIHGTFNPEGAVLLSLFDNFDASGTWTLTIIDDSAGDTGTLRNWALAIAY